MIEETTPASDNQRSPRPGAGSALVFWFLIMLGVSTFAPCILMPEWRAYQATKVAQQREQHRIDRLRKLVDSERRQLDAIQNDPTVVARLAQRDLGFRRPGERAIPVPVEDTVQYASIAELDDDGFLAQPVLPPAWIMHAASWLPAMNYDAVFCDSGTRPVVMTMSIAVIAAAVFLFHRPTA